MSIPFQLHRSSRNMQDPTAMEAGLAILYGTFVKYASGEDDNDPTTISKKELAKLLEEQLPHLGGVSHTSSISTCMYLVVVIMKVHKHASMYCNRDPIRSNEIWS